MKALGIIIGTVVVVAGCTIGIQPNGESPTITYTVPRSYQTVYLRAQNQAAECLRGKQQYDVYAEVDPIMQSATVSVKGLSDTVEVARTELKAIDAKNTQVTHTVWGRSPWDQNALNAMRRSILMDTSVCVAYN